MKKVILYILLTVCTISLIAQAERQLTVSEIRQQTVVTEPLTLQKGYFKIGCGLNYYFMSSDMYNNNWRRKTTYGYFSNTFGFPFSFGYGLTNKLELDLSTSYINSISTSCYKVFNYYRSSTIVHKTKTITKGFTDLSVLAKYKLFDENNSLPSVALGLKLSIPYGKKDPTISSDSQTIYDATSCGYYELGFYLFLKKVYYPFSIESGLDFFHSFPTDLKIIYRDTTKTHINYGNSFFFYISLNYRPCDWINLQNDISYINNEAPEYFDNKYKSLEYSSVVIRWDPAIVFQIKNIRVIQGLYFVVLGKNYNTTPIAYVTLAVKI